MSKEEKKLPNSPQTPSSILLPSGASASFLSHGNKSARKLSFSDFDVSFGPRGALIHEHDLNHTNTELDVSEIGSDCEEEMASHSNKFQVDAMDNPRKGDQSHTLSSNPTAQAENAGQNPTTSQSPFASILVPAPQIPELCVSKYRDRMKTLLTGAKQEFDRCTRMSSISSTSFTRQEDIEEDASCTAVSSIKVIENEELEVERLKLKHCESVIESLQKKILLLEENASVTNSVTELQKKTVEEVGSTFESLSLEFEERERARMSLCQRILAENFNLQGNLTLAQRLAYDCAKQVDNLKEIAELKQVELDQLYVQIKLLTHQNESQSGKLQDVLDEIACLKKEKAETQRKVESLQSIMKQNDEKYTLLEKSLKGKNMEIQSLRVEVAAEKSAARLGLEHKDRECKVQLDAAIKRIEKEWISNCAEISEKKEAKITQLENELKQMTEEMEHKICRLSAERDAARSKLELLEKNLEKKEAAMCSEIQSRLARKYQELLSEFGRLSSSPQNRSSASRYADSLNSTTQDFGPDADERKQQLQILLRQAIQKTPSEKLKSGNPSHPLDPPSDGRSWRQ